MGNFNSNHNSRLKPQESIDDAPLRTDWVPLQFFLKTIEDIRPFASEKQINICKDMETNKIITMILLKRLV